MLTFLFWNIAGNSIEEIISQIAIEQSVDVLILAECNIPLTTLLMSLNKDTKSIFHSTRSNCKSIQIFTKFSRKFIIPTLEHDRMSIRTINLPGRLPVLLVALHLQSKLFSTTDEQGEETTIISQEIESAEIKVGHENTIVIGDLNQNPFERGLMTARGFNATMSAHIASKKHRTVKGNSYKFFYNPMWGLIGDYNGDPPGTYYYNSSSHVNYYWNTFDQVLMRPQLIEYFNIQELKILSTYGSKSMLKSSNYPDKKNISDHLPILFKLNV